MNSSKSLNLTSTLTQNEFSFVLLHAFINLIINRRWLFANQLSNYFDLKGLPKLSFFEEHAVPIMNVAIGGSGRSGHMELEGFSLKTIQDVVSFSNIFSTFY